MYKDTREKHKGKSVYLQTPTAKLTCNEVTKGRARTWSKNIGMQDELVVCPFAWKRWLGDAPPYLSDFAGTPFSGIKGETLDRLKYRAAGNTLLHEALHALNLVEYDICQLATSRNTLLETNIINQDLGDLSVQYGGKTQGAYGAEGVQALARKDPNKVLHNAGTRCLLFQFCPLF